MNRSYRSIFNRRLGVWQAASEHTRGRRKSGSVRTAACLAVLAVAAVLPAASAVADDTVSGNITGPAGGVDGSGAGTDGGTAIHVDSADAADLTVTATGSVTGGAGGAATSGSNQNGGNGGTAIVFDSNGTLRNSGTITGGNGGQRGGSSGLGGSGGTAVAVSGGIFEISGGMVTGGNGGSGGGQGGTGVAMSNASSLSLTGGTITGGNGGLSGAGDGGNGGNGLDLQGSSNIVDLGTGTVAGGYGGDGGYGSSMGNGGDGGYGSGSSSVSSGDGGDGLNLQGTGNIVDLGAGTITGGNGGSGDGGNGGNGGDGLSLQGSGNIVDLGTGTLTGGNGGSGGSSGNGGNGLDLQGDTNRVTVAGSISGGLSGNGVTRANAVQIAGSDNTLELRSGYGFTGNVLASGSGNVLALGGTANASFDVGQIGSLYQGFDGYQKTGASTWTLTGTAPANMGWHITGGTLRAGNANVVGSTGTLAIASGATFDLNNFNQSIGSLSGSGNVALGSATFTVGHDNSATTFSGTLAGGGAFVKTGTGTLTLTGINTYAGGTVIAAGTLAIGAGGNLASTGAVHLSGAGAGFDISAGGHQTIGSLSGVAGSTISLGGNKLTSDSTPNTAFAGIIDGNGSLSKQGTGTLTLSGVNTYTGATTVAAGTLAVNGSIVSATSVLDGGTLGGSGSVGSVHVESGGTLAPGNSIGTLTVDGDLSFAPGSVYRVETDAAGNSDRVNVSGTALLNGGVMALPAAGNYATNTSYTILNAAGGFDGTTFADVSSDLLFLTPALSYDAHAVVLTLARNEVSYASVARTRNQVAAAHALQQASADAAGDMLTALDAVNNLSAGQAPAAYDRIGGAGLVALRRAGASFATGLGNQVQARLRAVGTAASAQSLNGVQLAANDRIDDLMPALAQAGNGKLTLAGGLPVENTRQGFWLRGYGTDQDTDGDGNAAGTRIKEAGISVGFDTRVRDDLVVGAAFSHGDADVRATFEETGKSRGNAAAVYASYASGPWSVNGNLTLAHHANRMQRRIQVGSLDRTASARFDSRTVAVYGEITYDLPQATWTLQPLAGLAVTRNRADSFTETGADALNLQVAAQSATSARTLLGAKALFDLNGISLQPRAIWAHEFGDLNKGMTAQLQGAPAAAFTVYGVDLPRDALIAGLTIAGKPRERLSLFADVQGEFNSKQTNLGLLVGLRASW